MDKEQLPDALKFIAAVNVLIENTSPEALTEIVDEVAALARQRDVVSRTVAEALLRGELTEE